MVCVDSTGKFAISVLSGHIGGANELTHQVANILGAEPVVTTQSDCTGLWGLDTLPQRFGWFPVINAEPSTLLLAELAKTPEEKKRVCMNEHISLFVSGKPTALLLTVRNEGTDWMEAHLPPHVEVFYRVQDIKPSRFKLILCVSPQVPNFPEMPMICYVLCRTPRHRPCPAGRPCTESGERDYEHAEGIRHHAPKHRLHLHD